MAPASVGRRLLAAAIAIAAAAAPVFAQPAPPPPPPPLPIGESSVGQGVLEALAAEGTSLWQLGVVLDITPVGATTVISLIDLATGSTAAQTLIGGLPGERAEAIAAVTAAARTLAGQLSPARADEVVVRDAALTEADRAYAEAAIAFDHDPPSYLPDPRRRGDAWRAYQGSARTPLEGAAFYRVIGRDDLASAFKRRRVIAIVSTAVGVGALLTAAAIFLPTEDVTVDYSHCVFGDIRCQRAAEDSAVKAAQEREAERTVRALEVTGGALIAGGIAIYFFRRPHPIDARTARRLGAEYNRTQRAQLGLPVPTAATSLVEPRLTPYLGRGGGGLTLTARF